MVQEGRQQQEPTEAARARLTALHERRRNPRPSGRGGCQEEKTRFGAIRSEMDFFDLHVTRVVAELAGLIRKYKGRFILSRTARDLLEQSDESGIYRVLLRTYVQRFNWAYQDRFEDLQIIQHSWLFTLYLLNRFGEKERLASFYANALLEAYPMVLDEAKQDFLLSPEEQIRRCYTWRCLHNFAEFLGLATCDPVEGDAGMPADYRVKKLPLLDQVVQFHL